MTDVFEDGNNGTESVLDSIRRDWAGRMPPEHIARQWRDERTIYELELPSSGWFIDITHGDSLAALNSADGPFASLLAPTRRLTLEDLVGRDRVLTCAIATLLHGLILDDGWQADGIAFPSKWGVDGRCWAVWLRATDDGSPAAERVRERVSSAIHGIEQDDDLKVAAESLGLTVF